MAVLRCLAIIFAVVFLFAAGSSVRAYYSPGEPTAFVNDYVSLLKEDQKIALENKLRTFNEESSNEISVVIIKSLEGDTIENFSVKLFEDWGIGSAKNDNGVLLLVAFEDKKMRIEVGYGLEGALPDAIANQIINQSLKPYFQVGEYYRGIDAAVDDMAAATRNEYLAAAGAENLPASSVLRRLGSDFGLFILFIIYALISGARRYLAKTKHWWPGGLWGGAIGLIIALLFFRSLLYLIALPLILAGFGLLFDYLASRVLPASKTPRRGGGIWFWPGGGNSGGGFGGFGGGGFGGFGGGSSGGGGASGSW